MPAPAGGFADKIGNRYEAQYLIWAALDLIDGERQSLRWEGVGDAFRGIEYRSRLSDGLIEAAQCKSSRDAHWTIAALASEGVLTAIRTQLSDQGTDRFALILASRAPDLHGLAERAAASDGTDSFAQSLSADLQQALARLVRAWGLTDSAQDREVVRALLSRVRVHEHATLESTERLVEKRCGDLFVNPSTSVRAAIREVLEEHLGQEVTADLLVRALRSERYGIQPRDWSRLPDQVQAVEALRERFRSQLGRLLIRGRLIPRSESEAALKAITDPEGSKVILLHGGAGIGKSGVLYEIVERLHPGTCVIPLRLDNSLPTGGGLLRYSRDILQLPDTPDRCAARLSGGRRAVIVVDQLDAVRWAGVHSTAAWDVTLELLEAAMRSSNLSVVVACRTFDMKDDPNLRNWRKEQAELGRIQEIEVKPLDAAAVESVLASGALARPTPQQVTLLRNPLMLSLWCDLASQGADLTGISASSGLLSEHWRSVKRRLAQRWDIPDQEAESVLAEIRTWAESRGRLDFPDSIVAHRAALDALASESYLDRLDNNRFRVAHQRYLDHQVALSVFREVTRAGASVAQWLRGTDQSLMRREQVRQVLVLLRDGDPDRYAATITELLEAPGVREHMRDLVLRMVAESAPILPGESALITRLADDARWVPRVRSRTLTTPAWWMHLVTHGVLQRWLMSDVDSEWQWAAWALSRLAETDAKMVSLSLDTWSREHSLSRARLVKCLPYTAEYDTPLMARWRFAAQRSGELHCDLFEVTHIAKEHPMAALRYAAHVLRWELANIQHPRLMPKGPPDRFERWSSQRGSDFVALRMLATAVPREAWVTMAPLLLRSLRWLERGNARSHGQPRARLAWNHPVRTLNTVARAILEAAGKRLGQTDPTWLWVQLRPFLTLRSRTAARLSATIIGSLAAPIPTEAVRWLATDLRRLAARGPRDEPRRYWYGRRIVRNLWNVAPESRELVVGALTRFHDNGERVYLRYRHDYIREGHPDWVRNLVGLPQYLLLSALPVAALDEDTRARLAQWDAKFGLNTRSLRCSRPAQWFISQPGDWKPLRRDRHLKPMRDLIPTERIPRVSDQHWAAMADPHWSERIAARWKGSDRLSFETPDRMVEAAFALAVKSNPSRFVRLAGKLPLNAADHWFESALAAAAVTEPDKNVATPDWQPASASEVEACLARIAQRSGKHLAMTLARLERSRPAELWSDSTIDQVCEQALSHVDPVADPKDDLKSAEELVQMSINCARGVAVGAIERLMWHRPEKRDQFIGVAQRVVHDPHPAVRIAAIGLAGPVLNEDPALAIALVDAACANRDVRVLHSYRLHYLLQFLWWRTDPRIEAILARMATSRIDRVEQDGSFYATVLSHRKGRMKEVAAQCARGTVAQRKGAARALAKLTEPTPDGEAAATALREFLDDADSSVAGDAASVFREDDVMRSSLGPALATHFVSSQQFSRDPDDLVFPLSEFAGDLLPFQPALAAIVKRAATDMSGLSGNPQLRGYRFADKTTECILRIYERAQGTQHATVREWCLDQIDALVAGGSSFGEQVLARLDTDA